jgi:hypothetical protein
MIILGLCSHEHKEGNCELKFHHKKIVVFSCIFMTFLARFKRSNQISQKTTKNHSKNKRRVIKYFVQDNLVEDEPQHEYDKKKLNICKAIEWKENSHNMQRQSS